MSRRSHGRETSSPSGSSADNEKRERIRDWIPLQGPVAGVVAFVVGYALAYVLEGDRMMRDFRRGFNDGSGSTEQFREAGGSLPEKWHLVGSFYHGHHNAEVSLTVSGQYGSVSQAFTPEFLSGSLVLWLIPVAVLGIAGFVVAYSTDTSGPLDGAIAGGSVGLGYLPVAVASVFVFTWSTSITTLRGTRSLTLAPELATVVIFTGVLYPALFAGGGGALAGAIGIGETTSRENQNRDNRGQRRQTTAGNAAQRTAGQNTTRDSSGRNATQNSAGQDSKPSTGRNKRGQRIRNDDLER